MDEADDKTMVLEETVEPVDTEEIPDDYAEKILKTQDASLTFDDDEDPTLILEEEEPDMAEEDATFVLPELDLEPDTEEIVAAYLDCITGPHSGEVFKLTTGITTIGRASDNILPLSKDKETSRKHSKISFESGGFIVEDLGSLNGTFINDERIDTPRHLEDGDVILIGVSTLVYHTK
jgi:hypothetical protein